MFTAFCKKSVNGVYRVLWKWMVLAVVVLCVCVCVYVCGSDTGWLVWTGGLWRCDWCLWGLVEVWKCLLDSVEVWLVVTGFCGNVIGGYWVLWKCDWCSLGSVEVNDTDWFLWKWHSVVGFYWVLWKCKLCLLGSVEVWMMIPSFCEVEWYFCM